MYPLLIVLTSVQSHMLKMELSLYWEIYQFAGHRSVYVFS
jgi:hypothetical protein